MTTSSTIFTTRLFCFTSHNCIIHTKVLSCLHEPIRTTFGHSPSIGVRHNLQDAPKRISPPRASLMRRCFVHRLASPAISAAVKRGALLDFQWLRFQRPFSTAAVGQQHDNEQGSPGDAQSLVRYKSAKTATFKQRSSTKKALRSNEAYNIANLAGLKISRVPGRHDLPQILGVHRALKVLQPDITLQMSADMMRQELEIILEGVDEQLQHDLSTLANLIFNTHPKEIPGATSLVWEKLSALDNPEIGILLLLRIALDRPRRFLRVITQIKPKQLDQTLEPFHAAARLGQALCYVYCFLMCRHMQRASRFPDLFFEVLMKLQHRSESVLKLLPRYSLYRLCPQSIQGAIANALKLQKLHDLHWEDDLIAAQACSSQGDLDGLAFHLNNVYTLCNSTGNHFPIRCVEFVNTIQMALEHAKTARLVVDSVVEAILPSTPTGEMQAIVYMSVMRYAVENNLQSSTLELIINRLPDKVFRRSVFVAELFDAVASLGWQPPDHRLNRHLNTLLKRNNVLATYYLCAWHSYLVSTRGETNSYHTMVENYLEFFDGNVLRVIGLPCPKLDQRKGALPPTHVTLGLMLNSYLNSAQNDPEAVKDAYRSFRRAVESQDPSLLQSAMDGPRVYNIFLDAFTKLPEKDLNLCVSLVAEITREVTEESVKTSQLGFPWRKKSHIGPDDYSWCILLKTLGHHGQWEACNKTLESVRKRYPDRYLVAANVHLSSLMKAGKEDDAARLLKRVMMLGYQVDEYTIRALNYLDGGMAQRVLST